MSHLPQDCPYFLNATEERLYDLEEVVLKNGLKTQVGELNALVREVKFLLKTIIYIVPVTGGTLGILVGLGII